MELLIVGVGLIGGSLALALKGTGFAGEIVGCGRRVETLERAVARGAIDRFETDLAAAVESADVVLLAVPMATMRPLLETIATHRKPSAIVTDAGSVKGSFVADARAAFDDLSCVVPGHPIAGTENSGIDAAFPELFQQRKVILTPLQETREEAIETVRSLWVQCGAAVEEMDAEEHDRVLAATSHLPHVLAYSLVDALLGLPEREAIFRYAAGGFRDFTRIASSDPVMWRDICINNSESLVSMIDELQRNLSVLRQHIADGDANVIFDIFTRTKQARDNHYE
ncbi:MAG: prephenate dehydrogenase/arogenate dehydrogenase family protein [Pseudomonadota bacterium]